MSTLLHAKIGRASEDQLQARYCQREAMPRTGESRLTDSPSFPSNAGRPASIVVIYGVSECHSNLMDVLARASCRSQCIDRQQRRATLQLFHNSGNRLQSLGGRIEAKPVTFRVYGVRMITQCVYPLDRNECIHHERKVQYSSSKVGNLLILKSLQYNAFAVRLPESSRRQDCCDGENSLRPCRSDLTRRPARRVRYDRKDYTAYDCHAKREHSLEIELVHLQIPCSAPMQILTPGAATDKPLQVIEVEISTQYLLDTLPPAQEAA